MSWVIGRERGPVADLHRRSAEAASSPDVLRTVSLMEPAAPAIVLGSAQPESHVDADAARAAGVDVVRRRSGGGAVYVSSSSVLWVDILIPHGDPLWERDVGRATWWVGEAWQRALERVGVTGSSVWRAGMRRTAWSDLICIAGTGPGEVLLATAKVVGISQRRTRSATLFQTVVVVEWVPEVLIGLLCIPPGDRDRARSDLALAARGVGGATAVCLFDALVDSLPA